MCKQAALEALQKDLDQAFVRFIEETAKIIAEQEDVCLPVRMELTRMLGDGPVKAMSKFNQNFAMNNAIKEVMDELGIEPSQILAVFPVEEPLPFDPRSN